LIVAVDSSTLALKSDPPMYNLLRPKNGLDIGDHFRSYYRTGQAVPELGISSRALRKLHQHGLVEAEYTANSGASLWPRCNGSSKKAYRPFVTTIDACGTKLNQTNSGRRVPEHWRRPHPPQPHLPRVL
jgi:hypothetical protein